MRASNVLSLSFVASLTLFAACGGDDGGGHNEEEVITTIALSFAPVGGGDVVVAAFDDADGDGGEAPVIDAIMLATGVTYDLTVRLQNKLEAPPEEITDEVRDESDEHQLFFTGTAVSGPASSSAGAPLAHAYADSDANGYPVGLTSTIIATTGTGELVVTLPPHAAGQRACDQGRGARHSGPRQRHRVAARVDRRPGHLRRDRPLTRRPGPCTPWTSTCHQSRRSFDRVRLCSSHRS